MKRIPLLVALGAALAVAGALLAYEAGGTAYTKKFETKLLTEPKPGATTAATLPAGRKVAIGEVHGVWLHVSEGPAAGWVFQGNLAAEKPSDGTSLLDGAPGTAAQTTATAAARPLDEAALQYASSGNYGDARDDLEWLVEQAGRVSPDDVEAYLKEHKRGEYQ